MSAAAAQPALFAPVIRSRSWAPWAIVAVDVIALELALLFGWALRTLLLPIRHIGIGSAQFAGLALGILTLPLVYYLIGLYPGYGMGAVERLRGRVYSTFVVFATLLAWDYLFQDRQWSRGILLNTMGFALVLPPLFEAIMRELLTRMGLCGMPVLILGAGRSGALVARTLLKEPTLGFTPIGFLDDDHTKWYKPIEGLPVFGPLSRVNQYEQTVRGAIVAMPGVRRERLASILESLRFPNIIIVPDLFGIQSLWITSRNLGGVLGLEVRRNLLIASNRWTKRSADYLAGLALCILAAPLIAVFALWIKLVSGGPAFFRQEREGINGETIRIWKLRTMHEHAETLLQRYLDEHPEEAFNWRRFYKLKNDPRIIPGIGTFLRRFSLDELPQLWNIVSGDMSLVGPRPFPQYHLQSFQPEFRRLRTSVMPGLTGLWQVSSRSDGDLTVQEAQDTYYIRNWSLWLDLYILLRTAQTVLLGSGAY